MTTDILNSATAIIMRHGAPKMGAGDAIQLACANQVLSDVRPPIYFLVGSDLPMNMVARGMGFQVWNPEADEVQRLVVAHQGFLRH